MRSIVVAYRTALLLSIIAAAEPALAADTFILATGRRDPRIYAIDFKGRVENTERQDAQRHREPIQGPGGSPRRDAAR